MDCSTPGLPVLHQLPELAQTHVHPVGDAIQPSHPLSPPSPPSFSLSQHQDTCIPSFSGFPSHLGHHRALCTVPCANPPLVFTSSPIYNSHDMEITYLSLERRRNTEDVVHVDNAIFLSHKRRNEIGSFGGVTGHPLQYSCLGESHGQRSLPGYSPWGCKESDTTEAT